MAIATGTALAIGGATALAGSVYGANKQSQAAKDAANASERSTAEAIALERENEARRRQEWDATQAFNEKAYGDYLARDDSRYADTRADTAYARARADKLDAFDREQYDREQARREPYRKVSVSALNDLAARAGLNVSFSPQTISGSAKQ